MREVKEINKNNLAAMIIEEVEKNNERKTRIGVEIAKEIEGISLERVRRGDQELKEMGLG